MTLIYIAESHDVGIVLQLRPRTCAVYLYVCSYRIGTSQYWV